MAIKIAQNEICDADNLTFNFAKIKQMKIKFILDSLSWIEAFSLSFSKYFKGLA